MLLSYAQYVYVTLYDPIAGSGGFVTVTTDNEGRFRFDISDLSMEQFRLNNPVWIHPDATETITLNLANGYVP